MKKIIVCSVIVFSAMLWLVPSVSAQEPVKWELAKGRKILAQPNEFEIHVGDTVVVSGECRYYLTGDTIRKWVYNVCAVVQKIGGKRYPDGILLENINSWITPEALLLVGPAANAAITTTATTTTTTTTTKAEKLAVAPVVQHTWQETVVPSDSDGEQVVLKERIIEETIIEEKIIEPEIVELPSAPVAPVEQPVMQEVPMAPVSTPSMDEHRISLGVRGGVTSLLQDAGDATCQLGWDALLDLQYAYYGYTNQRHKVGIILGASVGYTQAGMTMDKLRDQFTVTTTDGDIQYTVSAENLKESHYMLSVEVPVMFSFVTRGGFFMNLGPRVQIPVYSHYALSFANPNVDAYFIQERVLVKNELITGRVDQTHAEGKFAVAKYNLLAGLELGYECKLKNGDALGIGAFADYNVYTFYRQGGDVQHVIDIQAPSTTMQPARVEYHSMNDVYGKKRLFLDCGLKLTYHFIVGKSPLK